MFEAMVEALTRDPAMLPTFDFTPSVNQPLARFRPSPSKVAEINAFLERENPRIGSAPLVLLNPNASDLLPLRRWPPLRYVQLARRLLEHYPELFIGFTGAPSEAVLNNQLADEVGSDRVIRLAGKTTLRQVLVLYTRSAILVTNEQWPGSFCFDDTDSRHRVVRAGDTGALCRAIAKRDRLVGRHRLQSVRERL